MSDRTLKIIAPIVILVIGAAATVAMIKSRKPPETVPPVAYAPLVRVIEAQPRQHQFKVRTHGSVMPRTESSLVAEVTGRVTGISPRFASGGFFEKGEVLLVVDPVDYELAVVTAKSQVAQAKVREETEEAQAEVAREEWEELGGGATSPLATRELQLEEARAALAAADASLRRAERDLDRTKVRAPYACRVRQKIVDVGRYVTPGTPVAQIYAIDYVEIRLPIPDRELAFLDLPVDYRGESAAGEGPLVRLSADFAGGLREWNGRVVRVEGEIDPVTRMIGVIAQVDNPFGRVENRAPLPVGLFVDAEIAGLFADDAIVLPRSAMRDSDTVLVVDEDDRLRFRRVDVLRVTRTEAIIAGGISAGERVCVSTLEAITDGMKVRPAPSKPTEPATAPAVRTGESGQGGSK